ncbi:dihydroxyacetone kinase subunit DhaL [Chloroflexota bacterium]
MTVTRDQILEWLCVAGNVMEENKEFLTQLDAAIGDAEHGTNMDRGFKKFVSQLSTVVDKDIGSILKSAGTVFISSMGGACGPLYGTLFMRAGIAASGKYELDTADLAAILRAGLSGVLERGKVQVGDKTMVDTLVPAVEAFDGAVKDGEDMVEALRKTVVAAEKGMKDTILMVAKKGRASYLGERSVGQQDPGATSLYLILKTLCDIVS